jgi:hypothetical protein
VGGKPPGIKLQCPSDILIEFLKVNQVDNLLDGARGVWHGVSKKVQDECRPSFLLTANPETAIGAGVAIGSGVASA